MQSLDIGAGATMLPWLLAFTASPLALSANSRSIHLVSGDIEPFGYGLLPQTGRVLGFDGCRGTACSRISGI